MDYMITITGISYFIDSLDLEAHQKIILKKEPSNKYDKEAIGVYMNDTIQIGYVANSIRTVAKGTYSAGRLYDKIGDVALAEILIIINNTAIARLSVDTGE